MSWHEVEMIDSKQDVLNKALSYWQISIFRSFILERFLSNGNNCHLGLGDGRISQTWLCQDITQGQAETYLIQLA